MFFKMIFKILNSFLNEFVCLYLKGGQCYCSPIILIKNSSMQTTK